MMTLLDKSILTRQPPLSEQIYTHLCKLIENGSYRAGEKFPSETELARSLEVSRPVVREALSRMKHDGLLVSTRGGRTRVAPDSSGLAFRIEVPVEQDSVFLGHLFELRAIIEPEAAALAALRVTDTGLGIIQAKLMAHRQALLQGCEGKTESLEFHRAIIDASGNPYFAGFINWIGKKLWAVTIPREMEIDDRRVQDVHREHELIVAAIDKGDPGLARKACRYHVMLAAKRQHISIDLPV